VEVDGEDGAPRFIMRQAATGESMPPESSAATRPELPTGKAARSGLPLERVEDPVVEHLDVDGEVGMLQAHGDAVAT
jgi:hypothetical protein